MNEIPAKPAPDLDDPEMGPFWRNLVERRLTAQRCTACGELRFPALPICPACLDTGFEWADVSNDGTVWSFAIYHRAFFPAFAPDLPYVVALVVNDDGVSYVGNLIGPREQARVGARVRVEFVDQEGGFTLPQWQLVATAEGT